MPTRGLATSLAAAAALVLPVSAAAKGASEARIDGPGLDKAVIVNGNGEQPGSKLQTLAEDAGFFPAVFGQTPDPMLAKRPVGKLGPAYTVTYVVPGRAKQDTIVQRVYPYAEPTPVSYTRAGQRFFGSQRARGGWYRSTASLKNDLVALGLPVQAPSPEGTSEWVTAGRVVPAAGALLLVLAASLFARRRQRPATA